MKTPGVYLAAAATTALACLAAITPVMCSTQVRHSPIRRWRMLFWMVANSPHRRQNSGALSWRCSADDGLGPRAADPDAGASGRQPHQHVSRRCRERPLQTFFVTYVVSLA